MLISSLLSGVLYFLSFPPFGYWYLIFPALFIFYISILPTKKEKTTNISIGPGVHGFIFGSIAYGVILFGIQSIGLEAWVPLTILMGLMYGFFAKVFSYFGIKIIFNIKFTMAPNILNIGDQFCLSHKLF